MKRDLSRPRPSRFEKAWLPASTLIFVATLVGYVAANGHF